MDSGHASTRRCTSLVIGLHLATVRRFFAIAAKMGLRQINLKSGKYVDLDTVINMHILLNFMRVKLYVWSISGFLYLVSHDVVFFSHPLPRLQSLIAIQLEMQLVLCDQL